MPRSQGPPAAMPLLRDKLLRQRTVFAPGSRVRMNVIPMFLNLFIPWLVFIVCCGLTGFWMMYGEANLVLSAVGMIFVLWLAMCYVAAFARKNVDEPTWLTYVAVALGIAAVAGTVAGRSIYSSLSRPYYEIQDLKVAHQLDAGRELGQNLMDAGIIYFAHNNALDFKKSWHFKQRTLYCVAPVVANGSAPLTRSYEFWAVGKDCCSITSSDFRCGAWASKEARSGIRILDRDELMFYRLAVQQAETLYGIVATHPIFVTWSQDPLAEVNSWNAKAFKSYIFMVALAFVVSLCSLAAATCKFAWIGRAGSVYGMDFYNDPDWKLAGQSKPSEGRTRSYSAV